MIRSPKEEMIRFPLFAASGARRPLKTDLFVETSVNDHDSPELKPHNFYR